ncbi:MAG: glycosyltransferase involved in cell wall biosynthesis [Psychroserpens sp.]|jgi:glycosyltransferase involved in cell wall biosynthesis
MKVLWIFRQPIQGVYSIENLFGSLESEMRKKVDLDIYYYRSDKRLINNIKAIKSFNADIYHITGGTNFLALFLPKNKTIITVHDIDHYVLTLKGLKKYLFGLFWWHLPLRLASITCISELTKQKIISNFNIPAQQIEVIPNCVDPKFRKLPEVSPVQGRILQVGTKKNKNLERVIEALEGINCTLVIVGKLSEKHINLLQKHRIQYENLIDLSLDNLVLEYNKAALITFISTSEGFGLPILEAQATGTPIITSNIEPMSKISGGSAFLVNPTNTMEIRKTFQEALSDSARINEVLIYSAKNVSLYSTHKITSSYWKAYNLIVERQPLTS